MSSPSPEEVSQSSSAPIPDVVEEERDGPVVGIGASAGGVDTLRRFFRHLPDEVGMAFIVVLHLSPDHESNLTEILQHETDLPVQVATDECPLQPDHVYVIPPSTRCGWKGRRCGCRTAR
jgi:two-component system CheB/CheR fusion protein